MKIIIFSLLVFLLIFSFASVVVAEEGHEEEIEQGRLIVEAKTSCDELSDEQLEVVGEYYMDLMHPGALHDAMHEMMGLEEGTERHSQFHIALAERMYCGEYSNTNGMMSSGMMGYGMMSMMYGPGYFGYSFWSFWNFISFVFMAFIFALVFLAVYVLIKIDGRKRR
ncbi:MAG: hypothetical protein Q8R18_05730 [bacterium]|nr:hypothetical protein [bacterium]